MEELELRKWSSKSTVNQYFETYFTYLGSFACDKAKEYAEKEREQLLPSPLQMAFVTFSQNEKLYHSLAFLQQKAWFGRREPSLRNAYVSLKDTFINIRKHEQRDNFNVENLEDLSSLISSICTQLAEVCVARAETINFYIQISKSFTTEALKELQSDIKSVLDSVSDQIDFLYLEPLKVCVMEELNLLSLLFEANQAISEWNYIDAMCHLQEITFIISKWKPLLLKNQGSYTFRSGLFGFGDKTSPNPISALCDWFEKFFQFLVAKFTFYFYESLSIEASAEEIKTFCAKTSFDFLAKSLNFVRKSDVTNVFLLLNVEDSPIPHHGYRLPNSTSSPDANNQLKEGFLPVLCLPQLNNLDPLSDVARLLRNKLDDFQPDRVVQAQTADRKSTIFALQLETRLYIVLYYVDRKHEKDNSGSAYLNEVNQQTKLKRIGAILKPGNR